MAFKATFHLQIHSSKGGLLDLELFEQLGLQATVVRDRGLKKCFLKSSIRSQLDNGVNGQVASIRSLGKDCSGLWMAPKLKGGLGPRLGDRKAGSKCSADSTPMPPFSRLRSGTSRSVLRPCLRDTAAASLWLSALIVRLL